MTLKRKVFTLFSVTLIIYSVLITGVFLYLKDKKFDAVKINLAGRQRMLTQKMTKEILTYHIGEDEKEKLIRSIKVFDTTLKALYKGGKAPLNLEMTEFEVLPPEESETVRKQLKIVLNLWSRFKSEVENYLKTRSPKSFKYILANNVKVMQEMNKAVFLMQKESENKDNFLKYGVITIIVILNLIAPFALSTVRRISGTIKDMQRVFKGISSGDFTIRFKVNPKHSDEVANLKNELNKVLDELSQTIKNVKDSSSHIERSSETILDMSDKNKKLVIKNREMAENVGNKVKEEYKFIKDIDRVIKSFRDFVISFQNSNREQKKHIDESSAAVMEIAKSVESLAQISLQARNIMRSMLEMFEEGIQVMNTVVATINKMEGLSRDIKKTSQIIEDVARKTNLLAINAGIEASHAGEAGKGFAVVADEIRRLSMSTAQSVDTIDSIVQEILTNSKDSTEVANELKKKFTEIVAVAEDGENIINKIYDTLSENIRTSSLVMEKIKKLTDISSTVSLMVNDIYYGTEKIFSQIENLVKMSEDIKRSSEEQIKVSIDTLNGEEEISQKANENMNNVRKLVEEISRFKVQ